MIPPSPRVLACLGISLLAACAPPIRDPWGLSVARGGTASAPPLVASFQADLGVRPHAPGSMPFTVRIYGEAAGDEGSRDSSRPLRRYRLDAFGFPSSIVASWLWEDGRWLLLRHDRREALSGSGVALGGDSPVRLPDVRAVLGFLSGEPLPGFPGDSSVRPRSGGDGTVRWRHEGEEWVARLDPETGIPRSARSSSLELRYSRHREREGHVVPGQVVVVTEGDSLLTLTVRDWKPRPEWKRDPFRLIVPAGYHRE